MKRFPKVTQLVKVEPFKITCLWNTGEVRVNDFETERATWQQNEFLAPLTDYEVFRHVSVGEHGLLQWENLPYKSPFSGIESPLDFDSTLLYQTSKPLSAYRLIPADDAA